MNNNDNIKDTLKNIAIHEAKSLFYKGKLVAVIGKKGSIIATNTIRKISRKLKK